MAKVQIRFNSHFIDGKTNRKFAPGEFGVEMADAFRLHAEGKGTLADPEHARMVDAQMASRLAAQAASFASQAALPNPRMQAPAEAQPSDSGDAQGLPEGFPAREILAKAGYDTVESLQAPGIEEKLAALDGIGKGTLNKIAIALGKAEN